MLLVVLLMLSLLRRDNCINALNTSLAEITDENYSKLVLGSDELDRYIWLIMFYAPWCHHCKQIRPTFEKLPTLSLSPRLRFGIIDAVANKDIATKNNITRFPSILYHVPTAGSLLPIKGLYSGPRTLEGLRDFAINILGPTYKRITSLSEWEPAGNASHFDEGRSVFFLLTINSEFLQEKKKESTEIKDLRLSMQLTTAAFQSVAAKNYFHSSFAILESSSTRGKNFYISKVERKSSEQYIQYPYLCIDRDCLEAEIEAFVRYQNQPLISVLDNHNYKQFSHLDRVVVMAVVDLQARKLAEESETMLTIFTTVAEEIIYANKSLMEIPNYGANVPVLGSLDGVKWRKFIKRYGTKIPSILVVDLAKEMHRSFFLQGLSDKEIGELMRSVLQSALDGSIELEQTAPPGIIHKIVYRFADYYPWSMVIALLPFILISLSFGYFRFPEDKKLKRH